MTEPGIVDTHLHLWDPQRLRYPWLDGIPSLNRPHLLQDYARATAGVPVERMVFLQCECDFSQYRQEVDWVAGLAAEEPRIAGIVPWAPLEQGEDARPALAALAAERRVKGIRRIIQFEADPAFCLRPAFVRGVQLVADFGLHFELCLKGDEQFANVLELVRRCPGVTFVLDHIGKPLIKEGRREPWAQHLRALAGLPDTWCKVSGMVTEADPQAWSADDLRPYLDHVLDCFGFDRVFFGGDWPVCTLASPWARWVETLGQLLQGCRPDERRRLFHDNAIRAYRLA
ncbi:MAG: amidohydrolase family protein [Candidatus Latescibacterota bacterium]